MVKISLMHWIYLSPHLDDIALSCGGLAWEQAQSGDAISIWSICAGDPTPGLVSPFAESLHERWETPAQAWQHRRREDLRSCERLGASALHFPIPDCIYRQGGEPLRFLYDSEESLWGPVHPVEAPLIERLADDLVRALPGGNPAIRLVCPWTFGGHVDHRLTRAAAERLVKGGQIPSLWYYAEYPYILKVETAAKIMGEAGLEEVVCPVSEAGMSAWIDSVAAHASQLSTFWTDMDSMRAAMRAYCDRMGGVRLWKPAERDGD